MLELSGSVDIFCEVRMALLLKIFIFFWLLPLHFDPLFSHVAMMWDF